MAGSVAEGEKEWLVGGRRLPRGLVMPQQQTQRIDGGRYVYLSRRNVLSEARRGRGKLTSTRGTGIQGVATSGSTVRKGREPNLEDRRHL